MNIAIIGYGVEGKTSAQYFTAKGHEVTICDKDAKTEVDEQFSSQLGDTYLQNLDRFDMIMRSAGVPPKVIIEKNPGVENKINTAINEFLAHSPTTNVIGVTGTKGKGTTSTLIANILEASGKMTWLGGNIGRSPLEFINTVTPDDWVVLELSSFQLYDIKYSPHIGVCLMIVPEHLDWHTDVEDYIQAKSHLFEYQNREDVAIYFVENERSTQIAATGKGQKVPYSQPPGAFINSSLEIEIDGQTICSTTELKLLGKHNWQNVCAAVTAVWQSGCRDVKAIRSVLTTFGGLPHRLEFVRELGGVAYYDDSFGTTPETTVVALQSFDAPKVIILGGSDKGASYEAMAEAVAKNNVRHAVLIGHTAPAIKTALESVGFHNTSEGAQTMVEIVDQARTAAQPGDILLLSTGCASYGLFKNYKDRGEQFKAAVQALS